MAIRIFNVSGVKQMTDTKDDPNVKLLAGKTIDLDGYHKIGNKMRKQIDAKIFKVRPTKQTISVPAPAAKKKAKAASAKPAARKGVVQAIKDVAKTDVVQAIKGAVTSKKSIVPPVDLKSLAVSNVSGDNFIKAVMCHMIGTKDNLGMDGKPNQPVLESIVKELRPSIKNVKADRRDRLYVAIKKEADSE